MALSAKRLGEKIGLWETTSLVQGIALVCSLIILFLFGDGSFSNLKTTIMIVVLLLICFQLFLQEFTSI